VMIMVAKMMMMMGMMIMMVYTCLCVTIIITVVTIYQTTYLRCDFLLTQKTTTKKSTGEKGKSGGKG